MSVAMRTTPRTAGDRSALEKQLLPYHALWKDEGFQRIWVGELMGESIAKIKNLEYRVGIGQTASEDKVLKLVGLPVPRDHEELLRTFLVLRGVVVFFERKLLELARYSETLEKLRKESENG